MPAPSSVVLEDVYALRQPWVEYAEWDGDGRQWGIDTNYYGTPGRAIRWNDPDNDVNDVDIFEFPDDGLHDKPHQIKYYAGTNKMYVGFERGNVGFGTSWNLTITEIDVDTGAMTDVVDDVTISNGNTSGGINGPNLTPLNDVMTVSMFGDYVAGFATAHSEVVQFDMTDWSFIGATTLTDCPRAHTQETDGTSIIITGIDIFDNARGWIVIMDPTDRSYNRYTLAPWQKQPTNVIAVHGGYFYIALEQGVDRGKLVKVEIADPTNQTTFAPGIESVNINNGGEGPCYMPDLDEVWWLAIGDYPNIASLRLSDNHVSHVSILGSLGTNMNLVTVNPTTYKKFVFSALTSLGSGDDYMARIVGGPEIVQSKVVASINVNSLAASFDHPPTVGNDIIVIGVSTGVQAQSIMTIADTYAHTWTADADPDWSTESGGQSMIGWRTKVVATGTPFTVTVSRVFVGKIGRVFIAEVSGLHDSPFDLFANKGVNVAPAFAGPTADIAQAGEFLIGMAYVQPTCTALTPDELTALHETGDAANGRSSVGFQYLKEVDSQLKSWTATVSGGFIASVLMLAYKVESQVMRPVSSELPEDTDSDIHAALADDSDATDVQILDSDTDKIMVLEMAMLKAPVPGDGLLEIRIEKI